MPAVNRYYSSVAVDTTLKFAITDPDGTSFEVNSTAGFPTSYPYTLAVGYDSSNEELVTIIGASGGILTVGQTVAGGPSAAGRGVDGTNNQTHIAGETVKHVISARDMTEAQAHIAAEADVHGLATAGPSGASGGTIVGTTASQTLTNKTITGGTVNATTLQQGGVAAVLSTDSRLNPVGIVSPFAGSSAPTGWLLCDGTAISRTTYSALFGVVGTTYGAGDASTTFNVPDLRGRTPIGAGTGAGLTARTLGATTGVESVTLTAAQSGLPAHTHTNSASTTTTGGSHGHTATGSTSITGGSHAHGHDISASGGGSHTHDVNGSTTAGNDHDHANGAGRTETAAEGIGESNASIGLATLSGAANTTGSAHSHTMSGGVSTSDSHSHGASTSVTVADSTSHSHTAATTVTIDNNAATGASASHENMQPSLVLNYIIKH